MTAGQNDCKTELTQRDVTFVGKYFGWSAKKKSGRWEPAEFVFE